MKNDYGTINSAYDLAHKMQIDEANQKMERMIEEAKREKQSGPIVQQLAEIVKVYKEQNVILAKQVEILQQENERRKQEVEMAGKEAKTARVLAIINFCVTTAISVAALIVSIVK